MIQTLHMSLRHSTVVTGLVIEPFTGAGDQKIFKRNRSQQCLFSLTTVGVEISFEKRSIKGFQS